MKTTSSRTTLAGRTRALPVALLTLALSPLCAWAAGTATIDTGGQSNTLVWLNDSTIRIDTPLAHGGYFLARNGKVYMVNTAGKGGAPSVMEIDGMMQGLAQMDSSTNNDMDSPLAALHISSIKATGKEETVAGIEGEVYELTITDKNGKRRNTQAVFTDDPLTVEMTAAYLAFTESLLGAEMMAEFKNALPKDKPGVLRAGKEMLVLSINANQPAATLFDLPSKPINIGEMIKQLSQQRK